MEQQKITPKHQIKPLRLLLPNGKNEYLCAKPVIMIGRGKDCDLSFPRIHTLSRYQAAIFSRNAAWYIRNISSSGEILVNNKPLSFGKACSLTTGDQIRSGPDTLLKVLPLSNNNRTQATFPCKFCGYEVAPGQRCPACGEISTGPALSGGNPNASQKPSGTSVLVGSLIDSAMIGAAPVPTAMLAGLAIILGRKKSPKVDSPSAKKATQSASAAPVKPQSDDIQFRGTAPQNIHPGKYFNVRIMMYQEDDYQRADRESSAVANQVKTSSSSVFQANRGEKFRIVLQSPDVDLDAGEEYLVWNGIFAAADFEVFLPENYDRKQLRLRGRVYSRDAVLTDLKLILQVNAETPQQIVCEKVHLNTAFVSYASADREDVVARLQGLLLGRPDMDLFFDVESLRRGEAWEPRLYQEITNRDLFYLFWSRNANASHWVHKELDHAVSQKTMEFIEPIPLESPEICPPPESLMCKHFNDWTLRYLKTKQI